MKIKDSGTPSHLRDYVILSVSLSLVAILIVCIEFKIQLSEVSREYAYNKLMTIAGLIIGILGVGVTLYFLIMSFNIDKHAKGFRIAYKEMRNDYNIRKNIIDKDRERYYNSTLDTLSLLVGFSENKKQSEAILLVMGKIICKSDIQTEKYTLEDGIRNIGLYYEGQEDIALLNKDRVQEDIALLKSVKEKMNDEKMREQVEGVIRRIEKKDRAQYEAERSQSILRWWRSILGYDDVK